MSLLLNVTSYKESPPPHPMRHSISSGTMSIGRLDTCDWMLMDPDKYLSGMHVIIEERNNGYTLIDKSSNGVYINDAQEPVGKGNSIILHDGDMVYLGEYSIMATISANAENNEMSSGVMPAGEFSDMHDPFSDLASNPVNEILEEDESGDLTAWDNELINNKPTVEIRIDKKISDPPASPMSTEPNHEPVLHEAFIPTPSKRNPELIERPTEPTPERLVKDGVFLPDDWFSGSEEDSEQLSSETTSADATNTNNGSVVSESTEKDNPLEDDSDSTREFELPDRIALLEREAVHASLGSLKENSDRKSESMAEYPAINETKENSGDNSSTIVETAPTEDEAIPNTPIIPCPSGVKEDIIPVAATTNHSPSSSPAASSSLNKNDAIAIKHFLKSAGIKLTPELASRGPEIFSLIGILFKTSIDGMREVIIARSKLKNEMRLDATTIRSADNNPIKFAMTTEDALTRLLSAERKGYMPPVTAIQEVVDDLKAHQIAMLAGMQSALQTVLERFEPGLLEHRLQKEHPIGASIPVHKQAKLWKLFAELYDDIHHEATDDFSRLFGKAFGNAYEQQIWKLKVKDSTNPSSSKP